MTKHTIQVMLPYHLQTLAKIGSQVTLEIDSRATIESVIDAIELAYPMLRGTIRDQVTKQRRPLLRYFVCSTDVSHESTETRLPEPILSGLEPFIVWGAVAGG